MAFAERYGPWALIAGASEGVGEELARLLADRGVNLVLLARRLAALDEVAASLPTETRTLAVDLSAADAVERIVAGTADLEIGFLAYCAGADPAVARFLDQPVDDALAMVRRNCLVPTALCHHLAGPMVERGRGAIVLLGSGAGLVGGPRMATYAGSKAFDMVFAESLWTELKDDGVDVLGLILGLTDTPAIRRQMAGRGVEVGDELASASTSREVAEACLAHLGDGPTWYVGDMLRDGAPMLLSMPRGDAVRMMIDLATTTMDGEP